MEKYWHTDAEGVPGHTTNKPPGHDELVRREKGVSMNEEQVMPQSQHTPERTDTPFTAELRECTQTLLGFLEDPHPGLTTWWGCLQKHLEAIGEFDGRGPRADA